MESGADVFVCKNGHGVDLVTYHMDAVFRAQSQICLEYIWCITSPEQIVQSAQNQRFHTLSSTCSFCQRPLVMRTSCSSHRIHLAQRDSHEINPGSIHKVAHIPHIKKSVPLIAHSPTQAVEHRGYAIQYPHSSVPKLLNWPERIINILRNGLPQDVGSDRAISIRKHALQDLHVGIDLLRDSCMQETILRDAEGDYATGFVLWVMGVWKTGFHDGFDGVGHYGCDISI
ncbi:MAG: hypothetical protein Q9175_007825 [Cornicularia normoerica]